MTVARGTDAEAGQPADQMPLADQVPPAGALPPADQVPWTASWESTPPPGLTDAELATEQQLIARRYPAGPSDATQVLPAIPAASVPPEPPVSSAAPARVPNAPQHPVAITCPDCGASAMVELTRRDALDFCQRCDFPLFWARDQVVIGDPVDSNDDALRRLPGTLGRVVIASLPCPHCNEPNLPTASLCVRCGLSMQASAPPPPPRPVPVLLPEPPMEPLEDEPHHWWIWLLVLLTLLLVAGIVLLAAQPWN
ncbi:hypothetical protein [Jatrophihabitans sp.]|uniref:hypothetical protein n=1 Tax=Jatrophihabitans sp. TaxID=1932789 RepID=UPI002C7DB979|nr:hypothetical protein [Jatrophihabitans sp.]